MGRCGFGLQLHCNPQGLQLLLQLLVSSGYLRYRHGEYSNSRMARRWLTSSSSLSIAPYIIHSPDIVAIWDHLPEVVRENRQAMRMPYEEDATKPEMAAALARHYAGLASLAMVLGGEVVRRAHVPLHAAQLLDIGGSHAAYSVLFCRKYPQLHATVLDIEPGIEAGKHTAKQTGMEDCISFLCADIVKENFAAELSSSFDVALYFHIAHLLPPKINAAVLAKVAKTLKPGGVLVFVDQIIDQTPRLSLAALMVQFMALTMTTVGGTISGYSLMGSCVSAMAPTRKMTIEMTPAKIGRLMKKSEIFMGKAVAGAAANGGETIRCEVIAPGPHGQGNEISGWRASAVCRAAVRPRAAQVKRSCRVEHVGGR